MKRTFLIAIIGAVAAVVILALFAAGFINGPANNPCPGGQCGGSTGTVPFTVAITGRVINPYFAPPYAVVDSVSGYAAAAPGLSFQVPKLDFWNNNFVVTGNACITYPSGNTYCTGGALGAAPTQAGYVGGGGQVGWKLFLYETGPRGSYTIQVSLLYQAVGCSFGVTCVTMTATFGTNFAL